MKFIKMILIIILFMLSNAYAASLEEKLKVINEMEEDHKITAATAEELRKEVIQEELGSKDSGSSHGQGSEAANAIMDSGNLDEAALQKKINNLENDPDAFKKLSNDLKKQLKDRNEALKNL